MAASSRPGSSASRTTPARRRTQRFRVLFPAISSGSTSGVFPRAQAAFGAVTTDRTASFSALLLAPETLEQPPLTLSRCLRDRLGRDRDWRTSGLAQSDGCGAVMRIAPLSMVFSGRDLIAAARVQAVVTHAHPNAPAAAVAACLLLRDLLEGAALSAEVVLATASKIRALPEGTETVALALEAAVAQAARTELEWLDEDDIPDGDGGWRSPGALGLAVVAALRWGNDAALAIEKAARIDGDSDSVACLAGMFIGAAHGTAVLPAEWLEALPQRTRIEAAVEAMLDLSDAEVDQVPAPAPAGARTSETDPIRVCAIPADLGERGGRLGVTFAPGKRATSSFGGLWHRDLGADLDRLAGHFGVDVLVSLVEDDELHVLGIPRLVSAAERRGTTGVRIQRTKMPNTNLSARSRRSSMRRLPSSRTTSPGGSPTSSTPGRRSACGGRSSVECG
jgi:hypothetical protein